MSRDDRPGEYEENWKKRQDERTDERDRQFQEDFRKRQDKAQDKVRADGDDVADALPHLIEPKDGVHYIVSTPDHQEVAVHADHHAAGSELLAVMIAVDVMRRLKEAIDLAGFVNRVNETLDGRPLEELRVSISTELDRFRDTVERAFGDIEKWVTERASPAKATEPEKVQEMARPDAPALEAPSPEPGPAAPGKGEAERGAEDPAAAALQDRQAKELAELEEKLAAARDRLEARTADKPKDVRDGLMDSFNAAAKDARDDKAAQHEEELRKLREEQAREREDR